MTGLTDLFGAVAELLAEVAAPALEAVLSKALSLPEDLLEELVERASSGILGSLVDVLLRPNSVSPEEADLEAVEAEVDLLAVEVPLLLEEVKAANRPSLVMEPFLSMAR